MPLPVENLDAALVSIVRQIGNAHTILLRENNIGINITEIDVTANLIAVGGKDSLQLTNISATPTRISSTETPETVETSTQQVGAQTNVTTDEASKSASSDRDSASTQTQNYGRDTISTTEHKD